MQLVHPSFVLQGMALCLDWSHILFDVISMMQVVIIPVIAPNGLVVVLQKHITHVTALVVVGVYRYALDLLP